MESVPQNIEPKKYYFAYGSNMSIRRLKDPKRAPSATCIGVYSLKNHILNFHKVSKDGSGKCNALDTGLDTDVVEGVVFEIDEKEITLLDKAEGLGCGYKKEKDVQVFGTDGEQLKVFTYIATNECDNINDHLRPYTWYKKHVLIGALRAKLSTEYIIAKIEAVEACEDPDPCRKQKELAIYQ